MHGPGYQSASKGDPDNLTFEQMCLFAREKGIREYIPLKIARELIFDFPCNVDLLGSDSGELLPIRLEKISGHPISSPVDPSASRFYIGRKLFLLGWLGCRLGDIIIPLGTGNFSPELDLFDLLQNRESFQRFEQQIGLLLAKPYPCHLEHFTLLLQIRYIPTRTNLNRLLFSSCAGFIYHVILFIYERSQLIELLNTVTVWVILVILAIGFLTVVLKHLVSFFVVW